MFTNVTSKWVSGNLVFYDVNGAIILTFDGTNRKITLPSGSTLESLGTTTIADGTVSPNDLALAQGSILVGDAAAKAVALSAKTTGRILVGDGTTIASVAVSGDATLSSAGALTIGAGAITAAKLANNAAGLNSVGMGASASYAKTTDGVQTLATGTAGAKTCLFIVSVTEAFANVGGAQPTFAFGEVGTAAKFAATSLLTNATLGAIKVFPGALTASTNVIVTATQATVDATGAIAVSVIILPTAS